jgi:hypothetical protein
MAKILMTWLPSLFAATIGTLIIINPEFPNLLFEIVAIAVGLLAIVTLLWSYLTMIAICFWQLGARAFLGYLAAEALLMLVVILTNHPLHGGWLGELITNALLVAVPLGNVLNLLWLRHLKIPHPVVVKHFGRNAAAP